MKTWILVLSIFALSCAAIPLPVETQRSAAIAIGCAALDQSGCLDDENVQAALPGITGGNCADRIDYLADLATAGKEAFASADKAMVAIDKIDLSKLNILKLADLKNANCKRAERALGL